MWNMVYANKLITTKYKEQEHFKHLYNLTNARPFINNISPLKPNFLNCRAKQQKIKEEKAHHVLNENKILLNKMMDIETKKSFLNKTVLLKGYRKVNSNKSYTIRVKHLKKINAENKGVLKRLQETSSHYNFKKLEKDSQSKLILMNKLTKTSKRYIYWDFPIFISKKDEVLKDQNKEHQSINKKPEKNTNIKSRPLSAPKDFSSKKTIK